MLKVKIESIIGFGKTAEFATIHLMHYDLASGGGSATVNLYENDPMPGAPAMPAAQVMSYHISCTPEDTSVWGTDDMVFVDMVLAKAGLVRDTEWVQPAPAAAPAPAAPTAEPATPSAEPENSSAPATPSAEPENSSAPATPSAEPENSSAPAAPTAEPENS